MTEKNSIIIYGSPWNRALCHIYHYLDVHSLQHVLFLKQEDFPGKLKVHFTLSGGDFEGALDVPGEGIIPFRNITSVCLDGYYISTEGLQNFSEKDLGFIRTESWATLIAFFKGLSRTALVANIPIPGELASSKLSQVALMQSCGFQAPPIMASSSGESARAFFDRWRYQTVYKPIKAPVSAFTEMTEKTLERLDALALSPVHFERLTAGEELYLVIVGDRTFTFALVHGEDSASFILSPSHMPEESIEECLELARKHELHICSMRFRRTAGEELLCMGFEPFLKLDFLEYLDDEATPVIMQALASLLEKGYASYDK
jgi:hypothetical protein